MLSSGVVLPSNQIEEPDTVKCFWFFLAILGQSDQFDGVVPQTVSEFAAIILSEPPVGFEPTTC
jgi:hypothetical protein